MFGSLTRLVGDVVQIAAAPVEIVAETARLVTKPVAEVATEMSKGLKELNED